MSELYFSDREIGPVLQVSEVIAEPLWGGLYSLIETRLNDGSFGFRFPLSCPDGRGPYGTDRAAFGLMLLAEVPGVDWPLRANKTPETLIILDLIEFCGLSIGQPIEGTWHSFYDHSHLSWDRENGLASFVVEINRLLARNGVAFELTASGKVQRLLPAPLSSALSRSRFNTGDITTDGLLEAARLRILSPKQEDRRDGLEKLWDAFERIKTLEQGASKRITAEAMLDHAADPGSRFRTLLGTEAKSLTEIGNSHKIRHSEVDQEPLSSELQVDYLFTRMFAFIELQLRASDRVF